MSATAVPVFVDAHLPRGTYIGHKLVVLEFTDHEGSVVLREFWRDKMLVAAHDEAFPGGLVPLEKQVGRLVEEVLRLRVDRLPAPPAVPAAASAPSRWGDLVPIVLAAVMSAATALAVAWWA